MSQPPRPGQPSPNVDRSGTLIETEEDVRQALLSGLKGQPSIPASIPAAPPPAATAAKCPQPRAAARSPPGRPARSGRRPGRPSRC